MSVFKRIRIALIIFCIIIACMLIAFIYNIYYSDTANNNVENNVAKSEKTILNMEDNTLDILYEVAQKNGNWANLPLANSFKSKYNPSDGIFKDVSYSRCGIYSDSSFNKIKKLACYNVKTDLKKEEYYVHYIVNGKNELDDVEIVDKILRYDENGKEVIYKKNITADNYKDALIKLADPYNISHYESETDYFNLTENYMKKWSGGFVNSRGFDYYSKYVVNELSSFEDRIVYMKCEYPKFDDNGDIVKLENKSLTLYYRIRFYLNNDMWLDDVEIDEISKEEIEKLIKDK